MYSKRHLKRKLKAEKEKYVQKLRKDICEQSAPAIMEVVEVASEKICSEDDVEINYFGCNAKKQSLREQLGEWYHRNKPSRKCFDELLAILKGEGIDVPLSANAFCKKSDCLIVAEISPGLYNHFGIFKQLERVSQLLKHCDEILVDINIDGLPLFKSSKAQLWPILIKVVNITTLSVFPVGVFLGRSKPNNIEEFLHEFIQELDILMRNGLKFGEHTIALKIRAIICDTPARAFACGIVSHTCRHGCTKCNQIAEKVGGVLTYSTKSRELISDSDFACRKYLGHHKKKFYEEKSPFEKLNLGMVSQVPLDPMHLVDLGVMRKFLIRIITNKCIFKITEGIKNDISDHLKDLKKIFLRNFRALPED